MDRDSVFSRVQVGDKFIHIFMTHEWMSVAVTALIVVACVVVIWLLRKRLGRFVVDAKKKRLEIAADRPLPGVHASEVESQSEKVNITDETGSGVDAAKVRAYKDVSITNKLPPKT